MPPEENKSENMLSLEKAETEAAMLKIIFQQRLKEEVAFEKKEDPNRAATSKDYKAASIVLEKLRRLEEEAGKNE